MRFEDYDVNVHPTKIEVRFYNANLVHSQILGAMREKLLGTNLETPGRLPEMQDARSTSRRSPPVRDSRIADAMAEFFKKHRPVQMQQQLGFHPTSTGKVHAVSREKTAQYDRKFLQIHDSFIVAQTEEGFVIIDQHALHECIIYEDLCRRIRKNKLQSQKLLIPESFEVTVSGAEALKANAGLMDKLGIEIVPFGPRTMAVQAFPSLLSGVQPIEFIQDLIDLLESKDAGLDADRLLDEVLNMAACKAAIKAGQKLTDNEIEQLLADRQSAESASRCPHGRPTTIKFSISDLEKQFKRT
jgi:DNA mismatch repair protein MutL